MLKLSKLSRIQPCGAMCVKHYTWLVQAVCSLTSVCILYSADGVKCVTFFNLKCVNSMQLLLYDASCHHLIHIEFKAKRDNKETKKT